MCLGLLPVNMVVPISATSSGVGDGGNSLTEAEANALLAGAGTSLVEIALENNLLDCTTEPYGMCGGNSHMQGICVDDELKYMFFSYTSALGVIEIATGELVASIGGFGGGSFGTNGGAHLGCIDYYDGYIYGSLEYKSPGKKFYLAIFDVEKMLAAGTEVSIQDEDYDWDNPICTAVLLAEPTVDFRAPIDTTLFTGQDSHGHATNEGNNGHWFACSGIDGVTMGKWPGGNDDEIYMIVAYGVYQFSSSARQDNTYNVLQYYKLSDIWKEDGTQAEKNITFTYQDGVSTDWAKDETIWQKAAKTLYVYTGNTSYGAQNIEYEWDSNNLVLYTYGHTDSFGHGSGTMYVVDGSKEPTVKTLELGQSNTLTDATQKQWVADIAKAYRNYPGAEVDESGYMKGYVAELKCICGNSASHAADAVGDATWASTGVKKADQMICSGSKPQTATQGIHWLGHDPEDENTDYYYICNGTYSAGLYKRTEDATTGKWSSFTKVTPTIDTTAKALVHYSMDTEDLYEEDGVIYLKNTLDDSGKYDAIVEGTESAAGVSGGKGSALHFDAWKYPDRVDRVYLNDDTIGYINQQSETKLGKGNYSYSFWAKMPGSKESDGNFIPFIGFYREDGTYASVFEMRWRNSIGHVTNGIGDAAPGAGNISSSTYNPSNKNPGDSNIYLYGYQKDTPNPTDWHFYTVTENSGQVVIYVDGIQVQTKSITSTHLKDEPFAAFEIGGSVEKLWQDMNNRGRYIGEIDDVTIYSGVLTADQVAAAYAAKPADAQTAPAHPGIETEASVEAAFSPAYPVYDKTDDEGKTLEVTAKKAVSEVFTLDSSKVSIDGTKMTFSADYLESLEAGIKTLTVKYTDSSTGTLELTVTDRQIPVLEYLLSKDSVSGITVKDSSAYGKNAISTATEFGAGHDGLSNGSVVFDGYDYNEPTYVKLSDENAEWLNSVLKNGYTINFWANAGAENGNKMAFLGLYAEDARPLGSVETYDTNETTGNNSKIDGIMTIRAHVGKDGKNSEAGISSTTVNKGDWAMYTVSYTEAGGLTLYINGTQVANIAITSEVLGKIDQFFIGHQYQKYYYNNTGKNADWTTRGGFYGMMDNVSVYNYALTADEINTLYGDGTITPAQKTKPLIHWTMDANTLSGDGTILESSNGYESYYQNVTPVAGVDGKEGGALYFNGAADSGEAARVWLGDEGIEAINEDISNQVTMSFWMKADTTMTNEQLAYTAAWSPVAGIYGTDTRFLMVAEYRNKTLHYCATIPGLSDQRITNNTVTPGNNQWHFVVMSWDGNKTETVASKSSVFRRIYVYKPDGTVVVGTPDRAAESALAATKNLFGSIGHVEVGGQNSKGYWSDTNVRGRFVGAIDDLKVYNVPFTQEDTLVMYDNKPITNNELYLEDYQFEVRIADTSDLTFNVENAGELTKVSRLSSGDFSMKDGVVTLDHDAVADLGLGQNLIKLTFANGERTIRITVIDDREYFNADTVIFNKAEPMDMTFSIKTSFGSEIKSVTAEGLTEEDYTVSGKNVTVKKEWLIQQQPGAVEFTVVVPSGETRFMTVNVTNTTSNANTEPYPILYYKMDGGDLMEGEAPAHGAAAGIIKDQSGNGIDLNYGGLTKTDKNKDGTTNSSTFFDGYRDYDVSRAWLDDAGMEYLKDTVSNEITITFWHNSPRITSNYMPVLGLFAEDDRPLLMADFRTTGGERTGTGQETAPTLVSVPDDSVTLTDGEIKSSSKVKMDSTWHHYVVTYNNTTGNAKLYVDGVVKGEATLTTGQLDDVAKFEIGGMTNAGYYKLSDLAKTSHGRLYGNLDEIRVYNVVLSAEDVADVYMLDVDNDLPEDKTGVKVLSSIALTTVPKTEYGVGETLDVTGGKVTLTYTDETTKVIDLAEDMVSGFDSSLGVDGQILTVTYTLGEVTKTTTYTVNIGKALQSIAMAVMPDKVNYDVNEALDVTGGKITLTYDDGTAAQIDMTADMVSGFDSSKGGPQILTVTYGEKTTSFAVNIGKKLASIEVTALPQTEYSVGEALAVAGGKLTLTYDDQTTEEINLLESMISGFDSSLGVNEQILTVTYIDKTTTYTIKITKALTGIEIEEEPDKLVYAIGDELSVTGGAIKLIYDDETTEVIDMTKDMVSGFNSDTNGELTLTVTYNGKTATFEVSIGKKMTGIELTANPKLVYAVGEELSVTNGAITVTYDDNSTEIVELTKAMISGFDSSLGVDEQVLTIRYTVDGITKKTTYTIVIGKAVDFIELTTTPKAIYFVGEALDVSGGEVTLNYDDGTTAVIDLTPAMISGFDSGLGMEDLVLTVTYEGCTTNYTIDVVKRLERIVVSAVPDKLAYEVGEALDVTGGKIRLTYDDGTTEVIRMTKTMVSGFDSSKGGSILLTITYEGETTSLGVTIGKELASIEVSALPKTEYSVGEGLDVSGGKVTLTYNDGTTEEIDLTEDMISGFDSDKSGMKTLTVTYGTCTATYEVKVTKLSTGGGSGSSAPAEPDVTVEDDTAAVEIAGSTATKLVDDAVKNNSDEIVIAPEIEEGVTRTEVSIEASAVEKIVEKTDAALTVSTPVAEVTIPNGGLAGLASSEGMITVAAEASGTTVEIEISAGDEVVDEIEGGITVTVPCEDVTAGTVAVIVYEDGTTDVIRQSVTDGDTMTIPLNGSATIEIVDNSKDFEDVADTAWYSDAVDFVSSRELFSGTSKTTFAPATPVTRGMLAVVLHNLEDNPDHNFDFGFHDVHDNAWYEDAVHWAADNGIVSGYGNGKYGPNDRITREQLAVMLWNYSGTPESDHDLDFGDEHEISNYAKEALKWAVENGVMAGRTNGTLDPKGYATRAEVAQMMKNYMENVVR